MKMNEVTKEQFRLIFSKSPLVVAAQYHSITINYWINQQAIIGMELNYAFSPNTVLNQYFFCDLTEIYTDIIKEITTYTYNELTGKIDKNNYNIDLIIPDTMRSIDNEEKGIELGEMVIKK